MPYRIFCWAVSLTLLGATASSAQVTGISYTLSPAGERVYASDNAGLNNNFLYGGRLGFGFGEFLTVNGIYLYGNNFSTDFSHLSGDLLSDAVADKEAALEALAGLEARETTVERYGGQLRLNLGRGSLIPFVSAGTGILRLAPDGLDASKHIYADLGVGLAFRIADRYNLSIAAENIAYRYDPASTLLSETDLAAAGLSPDKFNQKTVNNPALSASLTFFLGGRATGDLTEIDRALLSQFRGGNFRMAVEPFYGQIRFNSALGFPDSRTLAGVNAGFDFGPYIGMRAFYWRDTEKEKAFEDGMPSNLGDLTFYGSEMNLRFNTDLGGRNLTPYLIIGGGYLNVDKKNNFDDTEALAPASRYFAIGGGGVEVPLTSSVRLQGGVRGLFMSTEQIEAVSQPSNVFGSLMYTGGINFNVGGSGRTLGTTLEGRMAAERTENQTRAEALEVELARVQARLDSLENIRTASNGPSSLVINGDTVFVPQRTGNRSAQSITIPIPEEGEIYLRFGNAPAAAPVETTYAPPMVVGLTPQMMSLPNATTSAMIPMQTDTTVVDGVTLDQIYQLVRRAVAEQQMQTPQSGLTAGQFNEQMRRMETRLDQRMDQESNRLRAEFQTQLRDVPAVPEEDVSDAGSNPTNASSGGLLETFGQRQLTAILPFVGARLGENDNQFLVGVRGDYRFPNHSARFRPELGFSYGDRVGLSALANLDWSPFKLGASVRPYGGIGAGFISDNGLSGLDLAFNLYAGLEYATAGDATFFGEFSTLDLFDFNRVIVGYRVRL